jgi:hypothetical protein
MYHNNNSFLVIYELSKYYGEMYVLGFETNFVAPNPPVLFPHMFEYFVTFASMHVVLFHSPLTFVLYAVSFYVFSRLLF